MIPFNQASTGSFRKFKKYSHKIWQNNNFSNFGPVQEKFACEISKHQKIDNINLYNNGTTALEAALKSLPDFKNSEKKYVLTVAFSYIATTAAILNVGKLPIYIDIDKLNLVISVPELENFLESNIVPIEQILCILPVHSFSNIVDVQTVAKISEKYSLPVIYDAAHSFGGKYKDESILNFGVHSVSSFHFTKVLSCGEGGIIRSKYSNDTLVIKELSIFGLNKMGLHNGLVGSNSKMPELSAALGLTNLEKLNFFIKKRENIYKYYLANICSQDISIPKILEDYESNFSYFPIVIKNNLNIDKIQKYLLDNGVQTRKYFSPPLNYFFKSQIVTELENTNAISKSIICLPIYPNLKKKQMKKIVNLVNKMSNLNFTD